MKPSIIKINPTYQKENGVWVKDLNNETYPEHSLVHFPPLQFGGNHKHPRIELFAALSEGLELIWLENATKHTLIMKYDHASELTFYQIPALLPHTVYNSTSIPAFLIEFASEPQHDVELIKII
jgi:hypothetical protein